MVDPNSVLAVIRASRPSFKNASDKVAFAVHASFVSSGFVLHAAGPPACSDNALSSPCTGIPYSLLSDLGFFCVGFICFRSFRGYEPGFVSLVVSCFQLVYLVLLVLASALVFVSMIVQPLLCKPLHVRVCVCVLLIICHGR